MKGNLSIRKAEPRHDDGHMGEVSGMDHLGYVGEAQLHDDLGATPHIQAGASLLSLPLSHNKKWSIYPGEIWR